jgi:hypothetical protein
MSGEGRWGESLSPRERLAEQGPPPPHPAPIPKLMLDLGNLKGNGGDDGFAAHREKGGVGRGCLIRPNVSIISYVPCYFIDDTYMFYTHFMSYLCIFRH